MGIRDEIQEAVARLGLGETQFVEVPEREARALFDAFLARFTGGLDARWWWEHFTMPTSAARFHDGKGFLRIADLVPDADAKVWFVAEDDEEPFYPVYEVTPATAQRVIGECYGFEYYLIAKDLSWLLCENHHDRMIAVGDAVRSRMPAAAGGDPSGQ